MDSNLHHPMNLIHICSNVANFGNLDSFSAYFFENHFQIIKNLVRKSAKPLQQIAKRLSERAIDEPHVENENPMVLREHFSGPIIPNIRGAKQFKIAKLKSWTLSCKKPDNCVYLNDSQTVLFNNNILKRADQIFFLENNFYHTKTCLFILYNPVGLEFML